MPAKITNSESVEQTTLFRWAVFMENKYPELKLMFHVPNGGKRDKLTATKLKAEGVKAGVPDIELPVGRGGYFGLFVEMKVGRNKTSAHQDEWIAELKRQGYMTAVCYGWEDASRLIEGYLSQPVKTIDIINEWRIANET